MQQTSNYRGNMLKEATKEKKLQWNTVQEENEESCHFGIIISGGDYVIKEDQMVVVGVDTNY